MGLLDGALSSALGKMMGQQTASPATGGSGSGALAALLPIVLGMITSQSSGAQSGDVLGRMMSGQKSNASPGGGLGDILGGMLGGQSGGGMGGLGSLLEKLQGAGLGEQVTSWVGTGANQPMPPDAIGKIFDRDALARIAQQAGISETEASSGLSQLLPEVVDQLTPNGQLPDLSQLTASVAALKQKFGA